MNDIVANHIRSWQIDSFQKLRFVLFLYQHPKMIGTSQEFAERLFLGDIGLLEEIINDLQKAGLVDYIGNYCKLYDEPEIRSSLQDLARAFEDPLTRQAILDQVGYAASYGRYQVNAHKPHWQPAHEGLSTL